MDFHEYLTYDPASPSALMWKPGKGWGQNKTPLPAGHLGPKGYWVVQVDGVSYRAHHIVWAMHGKEPCAELDHEDRNPGNNLMGNLRPATRSQNCSNQARAHTNSFGIKGLSKCGNTWRGRVHIAKKTNTFCGPDKQAVVDWITKMRAVLHKEYAYAG